MIKICYIIGQLGKGGAEKQLYELLKGINRDMFYPIVVNLSNGGYWENEIQRLGIKVVALPRKKNFEFTRLFELIKLLKKIKPHIVHTYMYSANSYGRIAAILTRVPIIIASERNLPELRKDKNRYQLFWDKLLAAFSDGIVCNSFEAANSLIKKYSFNFEKVFTIHNGINAKGFLKENSSNRKKKLASKVIGTIGRLCLQKNHKFFLDMAKVILNILKDSSIKFLIVGNGPLRNELEDYSKKLGIENNVVFTGERSDIPELLQSMNIFVMSSLYEGMSNAIMEAMLSGLPVVATDVGGNRELIVQNETGYLCPLKDTEAFVNIIVSLINNESKAKKLGENGRRKILNEFTIEKMIQNTESIYKNLLEKKHKQLSE